MRFNIIFILYIGIYTYLPVSAKSSALWTKVVVSNSYTAENGMDKHWDLIYSYTVPIIYTLFTLWTAEVNVSITNQTLFVFCKWIIQIFNLKKSLIWYYNSSCASYYSFILKEAKNAEIVAVDSFYCWLQYRIFL